MSEIGRIQYFHTLLHGEELGEFETILESFGSTTDRNLNQNIMGLGTYPPLLTPFQIKIA